MISIIVPIYNSERYLSACLLSIEQQNFNDYEVILIDDGSTDASPEICKEYVSTHSNARLFQQANYGQNSARFSGVIHSKGDYILFIDSDDCIRSDSLSLLDNILQEKNPDIISFDFCEGRNESYSGNQSKSSFLMPGYHDDMSSSGVHSALCSGDFNSLCNKVFRKNLIQAALMELHDFEYLRHGEDLFVLISVIGKARTIFCLPDCLYFYRQNESSITSCFSKDDISDLYVVFSRLIRTSKQWGSECVLLSNVASLKHLYWVLLSIGASNYKFSEQVDFTELVASAMKELCDIELSTIERYLRIDFLIPIHLLFKGHYRLALIWAEFINLIMNFIK